MKKGFLVIVALVAACVSIDTASAAGMVPCGNDGRWCAASTTQTKAYRRTARAASHRAAAGKNDCVLTNDGHKVCDGGGAATAPARARLVDANGSPVATRSEGTTIIGGRPAGCPHRYCGCGLRKYLGLADKRLNLASNWARLFPRVAGPRAGVAAVRSGHVMYIERSAGNGRWIVRDYNSGGGLSRLHVRSVRGYSFVNPHVALAQH